MLNLIKLDWIIEINKDFGGSLLSQISCYSSIDYYNLIEDKISSIIRSLIKNHHFSDGNKRTALSILLLLDYYNNTNLDKTKLDDKIIDIAKSNYSVEEISKLLFRSK